MLKIVPGINGSNSNVTERSIRTSTKRAGQSSWIETTSLSGFYQEAVGRMDRKTINLMRSLRKWESAGDYQLRGLSGEYGAYQFTDGCWNKIAPKCGIFSPLRRATREEQDFAMYYQIREWQRKGRTPKEIASMWIAGEGEPNAYTGVFWTNTKTHRAGSPSIGINSDGAYFNVPRYANNVQKTYLKYEYAS